MQDQIDQINRDIERLQRITGFLSQDTWEETLGDIRRQASELDLRWCYIAETDKMLEARVTKMALMYLLRFKEMYEQQLECWVI